MANMQMSALYTEQAMERKSQWSPYNNNGGTVLALAGKDYCIVAGDTRMSNGGYGIETREDPKGIQLTGECVLATSGMQADRTALQRVLLAKLEWYRHQHRKAMPTTAIAQLLSTTLYSRRFFPYYTFNVLGGLDKDGHGVAYSYDAVGSFERVSYSSSGTGQKLVQPLMDNQVGWKYQKLTEAKRDLTVEEAFELVKATFSSAGERDIYTGDGVDIYVITKEGTEKRYMALKKD